MADKWMPKSPRADEALAESGASPTMPRIEGVIFDMDGLMFDTQVVWDRLWTPALAAFGLAATRGFIECERGTTGDATMAGIHRWYGPDAPAEEIYEELKRLASIEFARGVPAKPGLHELLAELVLRDIPCAVASSSPREMIVGNLEHAGVATPFSAIVCGSDVSRSKPAPDIFLEAARKLGTMPTRTMVLEDSFQGVRAGAAGGFVTVMVPDLATPDDEMRSLCHAIVPSLGHVIGLLETGA